jgi:hypothetical protein
MKINKKWYRKENKYDQNWPLGFWLEKKYKDKDETDTKKNNETKIQEIRDKTWI